MGSVLEVKELGARNGRETGRRTSWRVEISVVTGRGALQRQGEEGAGWLEAVV